MKTGIITGAGSGMGRQLALAYVSLGWRIVGIDVDENGLLETQRLAAEKNGFRPLIADLTDPDERSSVIVRLARAGKIELFVHNAGLNLVGSFTDLDFNAQRDLIALNLTAPMTMTRSLLSQNMIAPGASIVFMSSLSHYVSYPGAAVYAATKDGLAHYARGLRLALNSKGIHVLTVFPGPTRTEMASRWSPDGESGSHRRMPPEEVAREIVRAVERRQPVLIPGVRNRILARFGLWLPGLTGRAMKRIIFDRLGEIDATRRPAAGKAAKP